MSGLEELHRSKLQSSNAVLEHLSGSAMGTTTLLEHDDEMICLDRDAGLVLSVSQDEIDPESGAVDIASLTYQNGTYKIESQAGDPLWVNGRKVDSSELIDGDIIEFGEKGPLSRYRLIDDAAHTRRYFSDICVDCWDYLHTSRKPALARTRTAMSSGMRRLLTDTTLFFRIGVLLTIVALGFVINQQYKINQMQSEQLAAEQQRLDSVSEALATTQDEIVTNTQLEDFQNQLSEDVLTNLTKLKSLEAQSNWTENVITNSAHSVVFLQGAFGFREISTGHPLRIRLDRAQRPQVGPNGQPNLTLDGDGPVIEQQFTGTGFAIDDGSILATNRHVAVPWSSNSSTTATPGPEFEPYIVRMVAYIANSPQAHEVSVIGASDDHDLALLRFTEVGKRLEPLPLSESEERQGRSVLVIGYPTGLRSMVARTNKSFIEQLQKQQKTGFWDIAHQLAINNQIQPLSSLGIVAQITPDFVVYDAATTQGGSGGPVLNALGEVVAVNTAIIPGYVGSNLGVPTQHLRNLIEDMQHLLDNS